MTDNAIPALAFDAAAPLVDLLNQRNAILAHMNATDDQSEADHDAGCGAINAIENVILARPAQTPMDAIVRLLTIVQANAEGSHATDEQAAAVIFDARQHFGIGYSDPRLCAEVAATVEPLAIRQKWQAAWDHHEAILAADKPITARHAAATQAGIVPDELEKEWDDSGTAMGNAEWALFETRAPDLAALLWKMRQIEPRGLTFDHDIAAAFIGDVEYLGGKA